MNLKVKRLFYVIIILLIILMPNSTLASSKIPTGTKVANTPVENKKFSEVSDIIEKEIELWQAQDEIEVIGEFEMFTIHTDAFAFKLDETIAELEDKTKRKLSTFFQRPKNVFVPLQVEIDESHEDLQLLKSRSYIDYEHVLTSLHTLATNLQTEPVTLMYIDGENVPLETIAKVSLDLPSLSKATMDYAVNELNGYVIGPEERFSFLEAVATPDKLLKSRDESSFLASGLYSLFLQAEFDIVTRYPQSRLPAYGELGVNAEVNNKENKDLIVINKNESPYRLKVVEEKDEMVFTLEGREANYSYELKVVDEEKIKPRTIYRYSKRITPGQHEVIQAGVDGLSVKLIRSTYEGEEFVKESLVHRDLYLPQPLILLVSPNDPEIEEEQVEINVTEDGDMLEEEITIDREGNIIRPDGSTGGSIVDLIPNNIEDLDDKQVVEEIIKIDKQQQQYEAFLDKLLAIYTSNTEEINKEDLASIEHLQKQIDELNKTIIELLKELIDSGVISEEFIKSIEGEEKK